MNETFEQELERLRMDARRTAATLARVVYYLLPGHGATKKSAAAELTSIARDVNRMAGHRSWDEKSMGQFLTGRHDPHADNCMGCIVEGLKTEQSR